MPVTLWPHLGRLVDLDMVFLLKKLVEMLKVMVTDGQFAWPLMKPQYTAMKHSLRAYTGHAQCMWTTN